MPRSSDENSGPDEPPTVLSTLLAASFSAGPKSSASMSPRMPRNASRPRIRLNTWSPSPMVWSRTMISSACCLIDACAASMQSITTLPFIDSSVPRIAAGSGAATNGPAPFSPSSSEGLARVLEVARPVLDETVERLLRRALVGNHVIVDALLHVEQQSRVDRLRPEILDHFHRDEEVPGERRALGEARILQHRLQAGIAAKRPPFLLHVRLRKPFEVLQRIVLVLGIGDYGNSLPAELRVMLGGRRVDEEPDLVRAHFLVQAGKEREPVHLHCDLARLERVQPFLHVRIGHARRGAALEDLLVDLEPLHRPRRIDEAFHLVRLLRVAVIEAVGIQDVGHTHRDALGATLGENVCAVHFLAVDLAALEELGNLQELVPCLRRREVAAVLRLELLLQLGLREPVLAIGPADRVAHRPERPVVRRVLPPP